MRCLRALAILVCLVCPWTLQAEPSIQEVQQQAVFHARLVPGVEKAWKKRAAWRAAAPQLRVTVQRDLSEQLRLVNKDNVSISGGNVTIGPDEQDLTRDFDAKTRFQVAAVWSLDELIFNRDTILVSQERRRRNDERMKLLDRVNKSYFERLEAKEMLQKGRLSSKMRRKLKFIVATHTATLDALTGGWFSQAKQNQRSQ